MVEEQTTGKVVDPAGEKTGNGKPKNNRTRNLIIGSAVAIVLCFCLFFVVVMFIPDQDEAAEATSPAEEITETEEVAEATEESQATDTARPSDTPAPTETPAPTDTREPTDTPAPTNTPEPTNTPAPTNTPTATPTPIVLTGSGDAVVDVDRGDDPSLVHIMGNAAGRFFAVVSYGPGGEQIDLLVNTTDPYDGVRPLDFQDNEHTTRFEVSAVGDWTIEILPLSSAPQLEVPGQYEGIGDLVILLTGAEPDLATITGNADGRFFGVLGYGDSGIDLVVNTTDPYEGTVVLARDTFLLEVNAVGSWSIDITAK